MIFFSNSYEVMRAWIRVMAGETEDGNLRAVFQEDQKGFGFELDGF